MMAKKPTQQGPHNGDPNRIGRGLLVCLASLVLLQPLLTAMHLAWADHQHRFNPALGLFEDVVIARENPRSALPSTPRPEGMQRDVRSGRQTVSFSICPTSNLNQARYATSVGAPSVFRVKGTLQTALEGTWVLCARTPLFMTAPKQSPPAFFG